MADNTLLDITILNNADPVIGLVESAIYSYPELSVMPAVTHEGITYKVARRTVLPSAQFAQTGAGVVPSKSTYVLDDKKMFEMNSLLEVPKDIVIAQNKSVGDILTIEGAGLLESSFSALCQQMYYGTSNVFGGSAYTPSPYGFTGFTQVTNGNAAYEVSLGGAGGSSTSAYIVALHEKGVSLAVGQNGQMQLSPWIEQQIVVSGTGNTAKKNMAYCSQLLGWFGLCIANDYSVFRVRNADGTTGHVLTDAAISQAIQLIPIQFRKNLHIFMNRNGSAQLQRSRSAVAFQTANGAGEGAWSPQPTDSNGIPITITEAITNTEA